MSILHYELTMRGSIKPSVVSDRGFAICKVLCGVLLVLKALGGDLEHR